MTIPLLAIIDISPDARTALQSRGFDVQLASELGGRTAAIDAAGHVRAVLTSGSQGLNGDELSALPNVEIICAIGAGYEMIDLGAANERGIVVTNGAGTNATAVADHAMTLLLAIAGMIVPRNAAVRRGEWRQLPDSIPQRVGVTGRKLGILGLGTIGQLIASRAANGFEMDLAYHNRRPVEGAPYMYVDSLGKLAAWADFLVLSAPGGKDTYHIVNAAVLDQLGPDGYLVNIGRGTVVDTDALVEALTGRRITAAALDVIEGEPSVPGNVLALDNLLLTPHMAGGTPESRTAMTDLVVENLTAFFDGKPVRNRIN